ncbi:MAG: hypothetical protein ACO29A_00595 [Ilumatobacteraceae bacterium]|jgi:hypothetical protein
MRRRTFVRAFLALICLGLAVFWVWALFFPPTKQSVVKIDDQAWTERAQAVCREANLERDDLIDLTRIEDAGPDALARRATLIDEATDIVEAMVDEVVSVQPVGLENQRLVETWENLFRTLIDDRRAYTDVLRLGRNEPFAETMAEDSPVSSYLNDFAVGNRMTDCKAPMDLAV